MSYYVQYTYRCLTVCHLLYLKSNFDSNTSKVGKISVHKRCCYSDVPSTITKEPFVLTANQSVVGT